MSGRAAIVSGAGGLIVGVLVALAALRALATAAPGSQSAHGGASATLDDGRQDRTAGAAGGEAGDDPIRAELRDYEMANDALARQVGESTRRLQELDRERDSLQKALDTMKAKLRAQTDAAPDKSRFDLSKADWAELAKAGSVIYRTPCVVANGWTPSANKLRELGLAPQDAPIVHEAYVASNRRLWTELEPICANVAGSDAVAKKIGLNTCVHLVLDASRAADGAGTDEAMREVGEIRAGLREPPGPGESSSPVLGMFLALTGESEQFQSDLAKAFGPEEAHRLAFANGMCASNAEFGGSSPR